MLARKAAQLDEARRRLARFVDFIARGAVRDSRALAEASAKTETSVDVLADEVDTLRRSRESVFRVPSLEWIETRVSALRDVLERRTEASALLLRRLLGQIVLEPVYPEGARPYYVARTSLDVLAWGGRAWPGLRCECSRVVEAASTIFTPSWGVCKRPNLSISL